MKKIMKKMLTVCFALFMTFTMLMPMDIHAEGSTEATIEYNVPKGLVPYIYCYDQSFNVLATLQNGVKTLPEGTKYIYMYLTASKATLDKNNSSAQVDGKNLNMQWSTASSGYYHLIMMTLPELSNKNSKVSINYDYELTRDFRVRVRKIATSDTDAIDSIMKETSAQYQLTNEDKSIVINGKINTVDVNAGNFVTWTQEVGNGNFIDTDATYVRNLPDGHYTVTELSQSDKLSSIEGKSSTSNWLNASFIKKNSEGQLYYTFDVNKDLVNAWMKASLENKEGTSAFFGFYTQLNKEVEKYAIHFDANGGEGTMPSITDIKESTAVVLSKNIFERDGYEFLGWNTNKEAGTIYGPGGYADQSLLNIGNSDVTLYAQWRKIKTVDFEVYVADENEDEWIDLKEFDKTLYDSNDLVYDDMKISEIAQWYMNDKEYLNTNAKYDGYDILVKAKDESLWNKYETGMTLKDGMQVRYVLHVAKIEQENPIVPPINPTTPTTPTPFTPNVVVTPVVNTPNVTPGNTENVKDNKTPKAKGVEKVEKDKTPKSKGIENNWALINLIATVITVLSALILLISKHTKEEEEEEAQEEDAIIYKRKRWLKVISIVVALISIVFFLVTEDISLPMTMIDKWTIWMVVIAVVQIVVFLFARKWKEEENEEQQTV